MPTPVRPANGSWWKHDGALAVVFTGLPAGDLVLPVRLAAGAGQWAHLHHFLADPQVWHKIDLVRVADRRAPGGWRYYAHLLTHQAGYQSTPTRSRRGGVPAGRRVGVDANVSNLSVASFPADTPDQLVTDQVIYTLEQQQTAARAAAKTRARQRALDRSRRNTNHDQYGPPVRQAARAARRCQTGLPAKQISDPGGPRRCRCDGVPARAYRRDILSNRYRALRSEHRSDCRKTSQAKHSRAADTAARIVESHGNTITIEDCRISTWAKPWGKRIALFSPGMLVSALESECAATGGRLYRAGTRSTALSQHCLCGHRGRQDPGPANTRLSALRTARRSRHRIGRAGRLRRFHRPPRPAHRTGRLQTCPRHTDAACTPARVGWFSQPEPATDTIRCRISQDRQSSPGDLC